MITKFVDHLVDGCQQIVQRPFIPYDPVNNLSALLVGHLIGQTRRRISFGEIAQVDQSLECSRGRDLDGPNLVNIEKITVFGSKER